MLQVKNLNKKFLVRGSTTDVRTALENVSFEIKDGEFVAIIGSNGSGKSTLLNVLSGTYPQDSGEIIIDGVNVGKMNEYKRAKFIGRVFQDPMVGTCGDMSILENLEIAYRRGKKHTLKWGFNKANKEIFVQELERFNLGLEDRLNHKAKLLSGGQRQALTLLMASLQKPSFLLLDEHTAALDPETSKIVMKLTNEIVRENNLTTLMVTHQMNDAVQYADRIIMIHKGHIVMDVSGKEKEKLTTLKLFEMFSNLSNS